MTSTPSPPQNLAEMADDTEGEAISRSRAILAVLYRFGVTRFPDYGPDLKGMEPILQIQT
jgi:hypothetical protein